MILLNAIIAIWPVLAVLGSVLFGYVVSRALKGKYSSLVVDQANSTIQLFENRISILEREIEDMKVSHQETLVKNKHLEELLLQKNDFDQVNAKLDLLLRGFGDQQIPSGVPLR